MTIETFELDIGTFTGTLNDDNQPEGHGVLEFKDGDELGRRRYSGDWTGGTKTGEGKMTFVSGDVYEGAFVNGVPNGKGRFVYSDGSQESAIWDEGTRHGKSTFTSADGEEEEDIMFWEGMAEGPAKFTKHKDGSYEDRQYSKGLKEGPATLYLANGDTIQYSYENDELQGEATYTWKDGSKETSVYVNGKKEGKSVKMSDNGDKEERTYVAGVLQGAAVLHGHKGDVLEFNYKDGVKNGSATYTWVDGTKEYILYDDNGEQNGPCKLVWANGAVREGLKSQGKWHGEVFYTYAEGPRKGKKDKETWANGEMVASQKFFGQGESWEVEDWEDLKKLNDLTKSNSPSKELGA